MTCYLRSVHRPGVALVVSSVLSTACVPAAQGSRATRPTPSKLPVQPIIVEGPVHAPVSVAPPPVTRECPTASQEALGDRLMLGVAPGSWVESLDELTKPTADGSEWREVERLVRGREIFIALEWQGNDAALVVLRKGLEGEPGYCVRAVWGYSFGGLGVELSIASVLLRSADTAVVALEATATFNNPIDDLSDPTVPRRIALAIEQNQAVVLADSQDSNVFEPYKNAHWYFDWNGLVVVNGQQIKRWRFVPGSGTLSPMR